MTDEQLVFFVQFGSTEQKSEALGQLLLRQKGPMSILRMHGRSYLVPDALKMIADSLFCPDSLAYQHLIQDVTGHETAMLDTLLTAVRSLGEPSIPVAAVEWVKEKASLPQMWKARQVLWYLGIPCFLLIPEEEQKVLLSNPNLLVGRYALSDMLNLADASPDVQAHATDLCLTKKLPDRLRAFYQTALGLYTDDLCHISRAARGGLLYFQAKSFSPCSRPAFDYLVEQARQGSTYCWRDLIAFVDNEGWAEARKTPLHEDLKERFDMIRKHLWDQTPPISESVVRWRTLKEWIATWS